MLTTIVSDRVGCMGIKIHIHIETFDYTIEQSSKGIFEEAVSVPPGLGVNIFTKCHR